jgi:hypothetical protein
MTEEMKRAEGLQAILPLMPTGSTIGDA